MRRHAFAVELRLRRHAFPELGDRELRDLRPSTMKAWMRRLQRELAPRYVRVVFANVSSVLSAAVDDGLIAKNPCRAGSVRAPAVDPDKVEPWPVEQVEAVVDALPDRYRAIGVVAAGCGLRQGEAFGLRLCDVDFLRHRINVEQQVKLLGAGPTIAKPKGRKTRTVPLPDSVGVELSEHLRRYPAEGEALIFTKPRAQAAEPELLQQPHMEAGTESSGCAADPQERHARHAPLLRIGAHRRR